MSEVTGTRPRAKTEHADAAQREALRQIRVLGDPVLREKTQRVESFDRDLAKLSERMIRIMRDAPGVGLAATQIGVVKRLLVYQIDETAHTLVNPVVSDPSDETEISDEGCLSLPGVVVPVERPVRVRVRASDEHGASLDFYAEELEARVIQHEADHLDGVMIVDRTTKEERARAMRGLREAALGQTR